MEILLLKLINSAVFVRDEYLCGAASNAVPFVVSTSAVLSPYSKIHTTEEMGNCPTHVPDFSNFITKE